MPIEVADQLAIQDLMARYARAVDVDCTEEEWLDMFTSDATMTSPVTGDTKGVEGLKRFREEFMQRRGKLQLRHTISNYIIDGDNNAASMKAYFVIYQTRLDVPISKRTSQIRFCGSYDCSFVRIGGNWKIARRGVEIDSR